MKRLRVLISAHELSPDQGSECAEGWNLVTRIAKYYDVTVLYAAGSQFEKDSYQLSVVSYQERNPSRKLPEFIAIPQPRRTIWLAGLNERISGRKTGIGIPLLYYWGYRLWQKAAFRKALELHQGNPFHLCHHLTQITFREPGYLWRLGIPFVWGPTGGLESVPLRFAKERGTKVFVKELARKLINNSTFNYNTRIRKALRKSQLVYVFSEFDQAKFIRAGAQRVELMLDAGSAVIEGKGQEAKGKNLYQVGERLKVIWVGQLVERKALDILIEAISGSEELINKCEVTVIGEGPLKTKYKQHFNTSTFQHFNLKGPLPHSEVFQLMQESDVLVHTSYREATSNVIPEALSVGLPVICHDISGMSVAINDTCGIKVPLVDLKTSITGFREGLEGLVGLAGLESIRNMSNGAVGRAQELSWDNMARQIAEDYMEVVV